MGIVAAVIAVLGCAGTVLGCVWLWRKVRVLFHDLGAALDRVSDAATPLAELGAATAWVRDGSGALIRPGDLPVR